jgi:hypothetical protein
MTSMALPRNNSLKPLHKGGKTSQKSSRTRIRSKNVRSAIHVCWTGGHTLDGVPIAGNRRNAPAHVGFTSRRSTNKRDDRSDRPVFFCPRRQGSQPTTTASCCSTKAWANFSARRALVMAGMAIPPRNMRVTGPLCGFSAVPQGRVSAGLEQPKLRQFRVGMLLGVCYN